MGIWGEAPAWGGGATSPLEKAAGRAWVWGSGTLGHCDIWLQSCFSKKQTLTLAPGSFQYWGHFPGGWGDMDTGQEQRETAAPCPPHQGCGEFISHSLHFHFIFQLKNNDKDYRAASPSSVITELTHSNSGTL